MPSVVANFNNAAAGTNLIDYIPGTGEVGADFSGSANLKISSSGRVYAVADGATYASGVEADPRNYDLEADYIYLGGSYTYMMLAANMNSSNPSGTQYFGGWDDGFQNGTKGWALGVNNAWVGGPPTAFTPTVNQIYRVRLSVRYETETSNRLQIYVDGVLQKETTTTTLNSSGLSGILNLANTASDTSGWHIDILEAKPVAAGGGALTAPTISLTSKTDTSVSLSATTATGGTEPYSYQWYRSTSSGQVGSAITGATTLTLNDTGLTASTTYYYTIRATDSAATPVTADSAQFAVTTNATGATVFYQIVADGDSLSTENFSGPGTGYWRKIQALLGSEWAAMSVGENGKTTATMLSQGAAVVDSLFDPNLGANFCIAFGGIASLYFDVLPADIYSQIRQYCLDRRAAGWKVFAVSLPSGTYDGGLGDSDRKAYNALLLPNWRSFADGLINLDADSRVGPLNAYLNNDHYVDTHHFSAKGNDLLAGYAAAVISQFVTGGDVPTPPPAGGTVFTTPPIAKLTHRGFPGKIALQKGDAEFLDLAVTVQGQPADITGCKIYFTVKRRLSDPDSAAILSKSVGNGITIVDATAGKAEIKIVGSDTRDLPRRDIGSNDNPNQLPYDVLLVDAAGQEFTADRGTLQIDQRVRIAVNA